MEGQTQLVSKKSGVLLFSYIIVATLWIFGTNWFFQPLVDESKTGYLLISFKDWIFIVISGFLLVYLAVSKREVKRDLNKSEQKYRRLFENSLDGIMLTNPNGEILRVNPAGCRILGMDEEEVTSLGRKGIVRKDDKLQKAVQQRDKTGRFTGELTFIHKTGKSIPVELTTSVYYTKKGERRTSLIFRDISDWKKHEDDLQQSLDEKTTLLSEIHHRIKNNLAVISGLLDLQMEKFEDENIQFALQDSQRRIRTIANIHEKLYQSETLSDIGSEQFIEDLLEAIHETYETRGGRQITYKATIDDIKLDMDQAVPIGLILNELTSNAYKHAFEDQDQGIISVEFSTEGTCVYLRVADDGKGLPEDFGIQQSNSLGMKLIENLTLQLDGELEYRNLDNGCEFVVTAQLS
jgi:PAS domain S-box-containing protein